MLLLGQACPGSWRSRLCPAAVQILDALVVLRDARIIHCDLKPENVLVQNCESGGRCCAAVPACAALLRAEIQAV